LLSVSTQFLGRVANCLIVHDEVFRRRLVEEFGVSSSRIKVIAHGVPQPRKRMVAGVAPTLLMFGYLKWYKGIDIAVQAFRLIAPDFPGVRLVIAGGLPREVGRSHPHRRFVERVRRLAEPLGQQVEFRGYVEDSAIAELYDAATVVLFPYRLLFGASGPLALAMGYRKPFIVSDVLSPLVPFWPFTSANSPEAWAEAIRLVLTTPGLQEVTEGILEPVAAMRQWPRVAAATIESYRSTAAVPRAVFDLP